MSWKEEYWQSIKSFDTEEKLDLLFYRPIGFLIAKGALRVGLSPTALTFYGLEFGLAAGFLFYFNNNIYCLLLASFLFLLSGIFDSSDGQLARMGGKSTKLGLVLDGICDNLVFASVYIGSTLTITYLWGSSIWLIAILAGVCHSFQSSLLDFYNREYLFFGYGKISGDYWNPTLEEARKERDAAPPAERILWRLRFSWLWQQNKLSSRSPQTRYRWREIVQSPSSDEFQAIYRAHNLLILRFWRLMGANFHTLMILVFVFFRRFDFYLVCVDILGLTTALLILRWFQARQDKKMSAALAARGLS